MGMGVPGKARDNQGDNFPGIWATLEDAAMETGKAAQQFHRDESRLDDEGC